MVLIHYLMKKIRILINLVENVEHRRTAIKLKRSFKRQGTIPSADHDEAMNFFFPSFPTFGEYTRKWIASFIFFLINKLNSFTCGRKGRIKMINVEFYQILRSTRKPRKWRCHGGGGGKRLQWQRSGGWRRRSTAKTRDVEWRRRARRAVRTSGHEEISSSSQSASGTPTRRPKPHLKGCRRVRSDFGSSSRLQEDEKED